MKYECINLHFIDKCNFKCRHCFVKKEGREISLNNLKIIIDKIKKYFDDNKIDGRINLAGGEPLLSKNIDEIIQYIHTQNIKVSIITNGYYLNEAFIEKHKDRLWCVGISVDSLKDNTNLLIGRCEGKKTLSIEKLIDICKLIKNHKIKLKINTCLTKMNVTEDFTCFLEQVRPDRFKVLEMLCDSKDFVNLQNVATAQQIQQFKDRHTKYITVVETKEELVNSYLIVDSEGNLTTNNLHKSKKSLLTDSLDNILTKLEIDSVTYKKRY